MAVNIFGWQLGKSVKSPKQRTQWLHYLRTKDNYLKINTDDDVIEAYHRCPVIQTIADKTSKIFSRINQEIFKINADSTHELINNHEFIKKLGNPHPIYSEREFLESFYFQYILFKKVYVWKISGIGFENNIEKTNLIVLPTQIVTPIYRENLDLLDFGLATNLSDFIEHYEVNFNGIVEKLKPEEIWFVGKSQSNLLENTFTTSPCRSQEKPINTIISAYEARNTLNQGRGGIGILSNQDKSEMGVPAEISPKEKEALQENLSQYGLNKNQYQTIITNANLKYQNITHPIKDLALNEGINQARADIADGFGVSLHSLNFLECSTFANKEQSEKQLFTNLFIPDWELYESSVNAEFKLLEQNLIYKLDHSFIEVLQADKKIEIEIDEKKIKIILNINDKIQSLTITPEIGIKMLQTLIKINEADANELINTAPTNISNNE